MIFFSNFARSVHILYFSARPLVRPCFGFLALFACVFGLLLQWNVFNLVFALFFVVLKYLSEILCPEEFLDPKQVSFTTNEKSEGTSLFPFTSLLSVQPFGASTVTTPRRQSLVDEVPEFAKNTFLTQQESTLRDERYKPLPVAEWGNGKNILQEIYSGNTTAFSYLKRRVSNEMSSAYKQAETTPSIYSAQHPRHNGRTFQEVYPILSTPEGKSMIESRFTESSVVKDKRKDEFLWSVIMKHTVGLSSTVDSTRTTYGPDHRHALTHHNQRVECFDKSLQVTESWKISVGTRLVEQGKIVDSICGGVGAEEGE